MTDRLDQASSPSAPAMEPESARLPAAAEDLSLERFRALCPYLIAADGDWRSVAPTREHRCAAVDPWAPLAPDKQRRLCLVADHLACSTYLAARRTLVPPEEAGQAPTAQVATPGTAPPGDARSDGGPGADSGPRTVSASPNATVGRWPVPSTAPVVLGQQRGGVAGLRLDRSLAQAGLVALMVLAFAVLAVARLSGDGGPAIPASPTPMATAGVSPSPGGSGRPTATPAPTGSPTPSAPASSASSPSTAPASAASPTSYRVRAGDTLSAIAIRFGTTVVVLTELNGIADPGALRVGQVLKLP